MIDIKIIIHREEDQTVETKGALIVDSGIQILFECLSLELAWLNNQRGISCIPNGTYDWIKVPATEKIPYEHISILNVEGREGVCIHIANFAAGKKVQLRGCVAVGSSYADINSDNIDDIVNSRKTYEKMMDLLPEKGKLIII